MIDDVKNAWKAAITETVVSLSKIPITSSYPFLQWQHEGIGGWSGRTIYKPDVGFASIGHVPGPATIRLEELMEKHYSAHCNLVGTHTLGQSNLGASEYVRHAALRLWGRRESFAFLPEEVDALVEDIAAFIDDSAIDITFVAPLVNFSSTADTIRIATDLIIGRLSDEEVSRWFGGRLDTRPRLGQGHYSLPSHAVRGVFREAKVLGEMEHPPGYKVPFKTKVEKAILGMRTFKAGPIGYGTVQLAPARYTPYILGIGQWFGDAYVPIGSYRLEADEVESLEQHVTYFQTPLHSSLQAACRRLSSAEIRIDLQDKLFDAVVGLEAILLTEVSGDKYRGELRYRFALNLAALYDNPKARLDHFLIGKKLYDLRSTVAHGGLLEVANIAYGSERLSLAQVATRACELLRAIVKKFLPEADNPPYARAAFWQNRYFRSELAQDGIVADGAAG